jgi:hypothetical protein
MKPLAVLLGIITGSTVALAVSLAMTAIVFVLLPEYAVRLASERAPLYTGLAWSWGLVALSGGSFIGELRASRWRRPCQLLLLLTLAALAWRFWPSTAIALPG